MSRHVVLLGDSVFDNAAYVRAGESVIEQFQAEMPERWQVALLAQDGAVIADVADQLERIPPDATDLIISAGGNDALRHIDLLERASSIAELRALLADILPVFRHDYAAMLAEAMCCRQRLTVCTIYDQCPLGDPPLRRRITVAVGAFNECIASAAMERTVPIIPLHEICDSPYDFSERSPIEPSGEGGQKIVLAIIRELLVGKRNGDDKKGRAAL